jgi:DNA topoisomerase I
MSECPEELDYVTEGCPGFLRKKIGEHFQYFDRKGQKITKTQILDRIQQLVIPPMWQDVWICKNSKGHLQVTGYDARGRKQYIYHPLWTNFRQQSKYGKLKNLGKKLPQIRLTVEKDLNKKKWPMEKILALIVMMLDQYFIRIGNKFYERENKTYGLTTLRRKHMVEEDGQLFLSFVAKSGKDKKIKVESRLLANLIKKISELPGHELFKYQGPEGKYNLVQSNDVNQYLLEISGERFTAKDFRTWGGTVLALDYYEESLDTVRQFPNRKLDSIIIKKVAAVLGNTTKVCREYYIHPKVMQVLLEGSVKRYETRQLKGVTDQDQLSQNEQTVLKILLSKS